MIAPKVAEGACDLEPESIQMIKLQCRVIQDYGLSTRMDASGQRLTGGRRWPAIQSY
jgi:hypothetical protein